MQDEQLSKNFKRSEFLLDSDVRVLSEKRSSGIINRAIKKLIPILQDLRDFIGRININCSYRNAEYNREVGGKQDSHHRYFQDKCACDFTCKDMLAAWLWLKANRKRFCYCYWDKAKNFFHLSGLTDHDKLGRVGAMWIVKNGQNIYE